MWGRGGGRQRPPRREAQGDEDDLDNIAYEDGAGALSIA